MTQLVINDIISRYLIQEEEPEVQLIKNDWREPPKDGPLSPKVDRRQTIPNVLQDL